MDVPLPRLQALAVLALAPGLAALAPSPMTALTRLAVGVGSLTPSQPADTTAPLVAAVALAAWACTGWLLLVTSLLWADRLPGQPGRAAGQLSALIAPAPVRILIRVALGTSLAASVVMGPTAQAAGRDPASAHAAHAASTFDWPTTSSVAASSAVPAHAVPAHAVPAHLAVPAQVVVEAGDSLWSLAAQALGPGATDRQIAAAWPSWWSANRSVVGADPDLIFPGTYLTAPPP